MNEEFQNLAQIIKKNAQGKKIIYIPNPGNYGDGLIRYATKKFFSDNQIKHWEINVGYGKVKYQLLPYLLNHNKYLFIYGGGGGWCSAYDCGYRICRAISMFTSNLIVLPSTYDLDLKAIKGTLFRRDKFNSAKRASNSIFCHDMAFYLTTVTSMARFKNIEKTQNVGLFMRTDKEAAIIQESMPEMNKDLSLSGDHMSNGDEFLETVAHFKELHTDRLHICIAGLIVGAKVHLYPGSYFKIQAIYDSSIAPNFKNIEMHAVCEDINVLSQNLN